MNFLINCSNIKSDGGIQVTSSLLNLLYQFTDHTFTVVLSTNIGDFCGKKINNTIAFTYNTKNNIQTLFCGRDNYLDKLVYQFKIDAVLTLFGPSRWQPRCAHLCGFARAQLIYKDNPYMMTISLKEKLKYKIWRYYFKRSSNYFYTENSVVSNKLPQVLGNNIKVFTVTNYYHQIFDQQQQWKKTHILPEFGGVTLLCLSSNAKYKNIKILEHVTTFLLNKYPDFNFRFVLTLNKEQCPWMKKEHHHHFVFLGKVDISECPPLYERADIMFMPTLLECFTATYPEAMRMEVPIVTTDLEFAHGLCGDAACYYSAVDAEAAAEAIYKVATDKEYAHQLTEAGKKQLLKFDNYEQRAEKLIHILEEIATKER